MANQIPQYLDFEGSIKFNFNSEAAADHFAEIFQQGLQGQQDDWPAEFQLGDYPWDSFRIVDVDKYGAICRLNLVFRVNNNGMSAEDLEDAVLDDLEALEGVDGPNWWISSSAGGLAEQPMYGGKKRRNRRRRAQKGGEAVPMPAPYLGKISGMVQPAAQAGQDLAHPNFETNTVRPFLPIMGGRHRRRRQARTRKEKKGGFVPSIMEPFAASAAQYATPMALYAGYKLMTSRRNRRNRSKARKTRRNRNKARKTRRN